MERYLLVRDTDGAILAELGSAESAVRMLDALGDEDFPLRDVSVVKLDDSPGEIIGTNSVVSVRPARFGSHPPRG